MNIFSGFSRFLLIIAVIIFSFCCISIRLSAVKPDFSISNIDASGFPNIYAGFKTNDSTGKHIQATSSDFHIIDDGKIVDSTILIKCADSLSNDMNNSILLIIDQSASMNIVADSTGSRMDWAKEAATIFINSIVFPSENTIGIVSFSKKAFLRCPFTQNKPLLIDSLNLISPNGGTQFDPPFLDNSTGAASLFNQYASKTAKRIIVFLTDGQPESQPSTDSIIRRMIIENIKVYAIFLNTPIQSDLEKIARLTGGETYTAGNKNELSTIYRNIATDIQYNFIPCDIFWQAPYSCSQSGNQRNVDITFKPLNITVNQTYSIPDKKFSDLVFSEDSMFFNNPPVNSSIYKYLTLNAQSQPYHVESTDIQPPDYFKITSWDTSGVGSKPPFMIEQGKSRTIQVCFTQDSLRIIRTAIFTINGTPCPAEVPLFSGRKPGDNIIRIIYPSGTDVLSICDTATIKWAGVDDTTKVELSYSKDNGISWDTIAKNATGLSYKWKPPVTGKQFIIEASYNPPDSSTTGVTYSGFVVTDPYIKFRENIVNMSNIKSGQKGDSTFLNFLCNPGNAPVTIEGTKFIGVNSNDFSMINNINGITLDTNDCIDIMLSFTPTSVGSETAMLLVSYCDGKNEILTINGIGTDVVQSDNSKPSSKSIKLDVFPNPAAILLNAFVTCLQQENSNRIILLKLFSVMGIELNSYEVTSGETVIIPVDNYPEGIFFIKAEEKNFGIKVESESSGVVPFIIKR